MINSRVVFKIKELDSFNVDEFGELVLNHQDEAEVKEGPLKDLPFDFPEALKRLIALKDHYFRRDKAFQGLEFEYSLFSRPCKKGTHTHFEIVFPRKNPKKGGQADIYVLSHTVREEEDKSFRVKNRLPNNQMGHGERVVKMQEITEEAEWQALQREYELTKQAGGYKIYPPKRFENEGQIFSCLVMERLKGQTLEEILEKEHTTGKNIFTTEERLALTLAFFQNLQKIHKNGIVHRDIKTGNIMIDMNDDGTIKLADNGSLKVQIFDFGLAKKGNEDDRKGSPCGTKQYIAPEMLKGEGTTEASDIFAAALTAALIFHAKDNWTYKDEANLVAFDLMHKDTEWVHQKKVAYLLKNSAGYDFAQLFSGITDLSTDEQHLLKGLFRSGFDQDPKKRPSLEDMIKTLQDVQKLRLETAKSLQNAQF